MDLQTVESNLRMQASLLAMARAVARSEQHADHESVAGSPAIDELMELASRH